MAIVTKKQFFNKCGLISRKELEDMGYEFKINPYGRIITEYVVKKVKK